MKSIILHPKLVHNRLSQLVKKLVDWSTGWSIKFCMYCPKLLCVHTAAYITPIEPCNNMLNILDVAVELYAASDYTYIENSWFICFGKHRYLHVKRLWWQWYCDDYRYPSVDLLTFIWGEPIRPIGGVVSRCDLVHFTWWFKTNTHVLIIAIINNTMIQNYNMW